MVEQMKIRGRNTKKVSNLSAESTIRLTKIRKERLRQAKGITLIALVITIIVLLILVGISISTLTGEDGILSKAEKATTKYKTEDYKEALMMKANELKGEAIINRWTADEYIGNFKRELEKAIGGEAGDSRLKNLTKVDEDGNELYVHTIEGYVYKITENEIEYLGLSGGEGSKPVPDDLKTGEITFDYEPKEEEWTQGPVTVKISTTLDGYTIQYSLTAKDNDWKDYISDGIKVEENRAIYARLRNNIGGKMEKYATGNVANIDKLEPNTFEPTVTTTTNSITITGKTTDQEANEKYGKSGVCKYYFAIDGGDWEPTGGKTVTDENQEVSYTFDKLTQGTSHTLKMKAVDKAGKERIIEDIQGGQVGTVPELVDEDIKFTYDPNESTWTQGPVTVTATCEKATNGYTMEYSLDGETWYDYTTAGVERDTNGPVHIRLVDGNKQPGTTSASANVTNIDKQAPTVTIEVSTSGNTATVTATATDIQTGTNAKSEIDESTYYFSSDGTTWTKGNSASHQFTGLATEKTYTFKAKVSDNAQNEGTSEATSRYYCAGGTEDKYKYCETCKVKTDYCWHCSEHGALNIRTTEKATCPNIVTSKDYFCDGCNDWCTLSKCFHCPIHGKTRTGNALERPKECGKLYGTDCEEKVLSPTASTTMYISYYGQCNNPMCGELVDSMQQDVYTNLEYVCSNGHSNYPKNMDDWSKIFCSLECAKEYGNMLEKPDKCGGRNYQNCKEMEVDLAVSKPRDKACFYSVKNNVVDKTDRYPCTHNLTIGSHWENN